MNKQTGCVHVGDLLSTYTYIGVHVRTYTTPLANAACLGKLLKRCTCLCVYTKRVATLAATLACTRTQGNSITVKPVYICGHPINKQIEHPLYSTAWLMGPKVCIACVCTCVNQQATSLLYSYSHCWST